MNILKTFFKDTLIYGLATVLPRLMNFILVPLHTSKISTASYSDNTYFYIYAAFFNVLLAYGMETAFFRFFSKSKDKKLVFSTVFISLITTTLLFLIIVLCFKENLAILVRLNSWYFMLLISVLVLDTLVVAPFAYLRVTGKSVKFTTIKLTNIMVYVGLNVFFLWAIPKFNLKFTWFNSNNLVQYIFIANVFASITTLLLLLPYFFKIKWRFSTTIFKQLWRYGWPIMIAGLAYIINENFDKWILPFYHGKAINGAYSGCYKLAVFMTIFIQAFRLGAEPFFFNYAKEKNAKETYAVILKYFVICGCILLVGIITYLDVFKTLLVRDSSYWNAIDIVPIVLLANLCLGIYFNLAIWYKLTNKTKYGMYISIIGALITILLNVLLIPKIGFIAAAWATLIAYASMMIISYLLGQKHYRVPYNVKRIMLYMLTAIALSYIIYTTNVNIAIKTIVLFAFIGITYLTEKKELKQLFTT